MASKCVTQKEMDWLQCCRVRAPYTFGQRLQATRIDSESGERVSDFNEGRPTAFGGYTALSADGTVLIVSDIEHSPSAEFPSNGAVYIYDRNVSTCQRTCTTENQTCAWRFRQRLYQKDWCTRQYEFQEGAAFGAAIAISGNGEYVAVGAPMQNAGEESHSAAGAVFIFRRQVESQTYDVVQTLVAQKGRYVGDTQANAFFGSSLALSRDGRILVVGAVQADEVGAAYVYENSPCSGPRGCTRNAGPFTFRQKLESPDKNRAGDAGVTDSAASFGSAVHITEHGHTIVVTASGTNIGPSSLSLSLPLTDDSPVDSSPQSPQSPAFLPPSISVSFVPDDTLIDTGSVFVYRRDFGVFERCVSIPATASPNWVLTQRIDHPEPQNFSKLGRRSVRLTPDGKYLAVASVTDFDDAQSPADAEPAQVGAVYLFKDHGTVCGYKLLQTLQPTLSEGASIDELNTTDSVAISDDGCTIAVGHGGVDLNQTNSGRIVVYFYHGESNEWQQGQIISATDADGNVNWREGARFGHGLDLSATGNTLAAGDFPIIPLRIPSPFEATQGWAYVFESYPTCLPKFAAKKLQP